MAGPVNGLGTGAQVPLANTFQPGQNTVRPEDSKKQQQDNQVKGLKADASSTHKPDTGSHDVVRTRPASNDDAQSQRRGSLVDITV